MAVPDVGVAVPGAVADEMPGTATASAAAAAAAAAGDGPPPCTEKKGDAADNADAPCACAGTGWVPTPMAAAVKDDATGLLVAPPLLWVLNDAACGGGPPGIGVRGNAPPLPTDAGTVTLLGACMPGAGVAGPRGLLFAVCTE